MKDDNKVIREHYQNVYNQARQGIPKHEDAQDVAQTVFMQYIRFKKNIRGTSKLSTWLYKVCVNEIRMFYRKKNQKNTKIDPQDFIDLYARQHTARQCKFENRLPQERLLLKISKYLKAEQKLVIHLMLLGYGNQEAAHLMGISLPAVKSILYRARAKIAEKERVNFKKAA